MRASSSAADNTRMSSSAARFPCSHQGSMELSHGLFGGRRTQPGGEGGALRSDEVTNNDRFAHRASHTTGPMILLEIAVDYIPPHNSVNSWLVQSAASIVHSRYIRSEA